MLLQYKTIYNKASAEIVEKKSRFIATVGPVHSEEEAQEFIQAVKKEHKAANHHVFAYRLEDAVIYERQSDDGEPSGTAGMPILDILRGQEIINGIIVVTRYFGGTLLGTGGLVRAYSQCAKDGLKATDLIEKILYQEISVQIDYAASGKIQYEIVQMEKTIKESFYTDAVEFMVLVKKLEVDHFISHMTDCSAGTAKLEIREPLYGAWVKEKLVLFDEKN